MVAVESPATHIAHALRSETVHDSPKFPLVSLTLDIFMQKHLETFSLFSACVAVAKYATYAILLFGFGWKPLVTVAVLRILVGVADFPILAMLGLHHKSAIAGFIVSPLFALILLGTSLWLR